MKVKIKRWRKKTIDEGKAQRAIFDALFPEIAKEAENTNKD